MFVYNAEIEFYEYYTEYDIHIGACEEVVYPEGYGDADADE